MERAISGAYARSLRESAQAGRQTKPSAPPFEKTAIVGVAQAVPPSKDRLTARRIRRTLTNRLTMGRLGEIWRRLLFPIGRRRFEQDLEEELRFHLAMKAEDHSSAGMTPEAARSAAQRGFG